MRSDDELYYRRRLLDEEGAIRRATSAAARERHEELASAYRLVLQYAGPPHRLASRPGFAIELAPDSSGAVGAQSDRPAPALQMPL